MKLLFLTFGGQDYHRGISMVNCPCEAERFTLCQAADRDHPLIVCDAV